MALRATPLPTLTGRGFAGMGRSHVRSRRDADPTGYGFVLEELEQPLDLRRLFGAGSGTAPLELEIGSGKGGFLVAESEARPDTIFLGVERARRYWLHAADRLRRRARTNARILRADAIEALQALPSDSIAGLHVYFPDPWPKRRHAHRRLFLQPAFFRAAERALASGAILRVASDDRDYFGVIEGVLTARPRFTRCPYEPPRSACRERGEQVGSNFERKYLLEGRRIQAAAASLSADEDHALADEER